MGMKLAKAISADPASCRRFMKHPASDNTVHLDITVPALIRNVNNARFGCHGCLRGVMVIDGVRLATRRASNTD